MLKTDREKRICAKYSMQDETGYVHCDECPLRVKTNAHDCACKAWLHYDRRLKGWVMDEEVLNDILKNVVPLE